LKKEIERRTLNLTIEGDSFDLKIIKNVEDRKRLLKTILKLESGKIEDFQKMLKILWGNSNYTRENKMEKIVRHLAMLSVFDSTYRIRISPDELWKIGKELVESENYVKKLETIGYCISEEAVNSLIEKIKPFVKKYREIPGEVRAIKWLERVIRFLTNNDNNLLGFFSKFDCPIHCFKKLNFDTSDKIKAMYMKYATHSGVLSNYGIDFVPVPKWQEHTSCYPIPVNGVITKMAIRMGLIDLEGIFEYGNIKLEEIFIKDNNKLVPSAISFYGLVFDQLRILSDDPARLDEIIYHLGKSRDGICTDKEAKCEICPINTLCANSKSFDENPEIIKGNPAPRTRITTKPKNLECLLEPDLLHSTKN